MTRTAAQMVADATEQLGAITPKEAAARHADHSAVLLDVREPAEWEHYIDGTVQVPRGLLEFAADPGSPRHDPRLDPSTPVIVFCRSGARAALAGTTLLELGFTDVANLAGGFTAWVEAGLPTAEAHAGL